MSRSSMPPVQGVQVQSLVRQLDLNMMQCRTPGFNPWAGKIPLEKDMATHSSILAWRIPWTEEPGGLQSVELQRIGHH